jgi:hypothetical protein
VLEEGFVGDWGNEDEEASFVESGLEDEPGCSGVSFLLFLLFFLLELVVSAGADFADISTTACKETEVKPN